MKTVIVTATGTCPQCQTHNFTEVTGQVPDGPNAAYVTGTASCGACGAAVPVSGASGR